MINLNGIDKKYKTYQFNYASLWLYINFDFKFNYQCVNEI